MIAVPRKDDRSRVERIATALKSMGGEIPPELAAKIASEIDGAIPPGTEIETIKAGTLDLDITGAMAESLAELPGEVVALCLRTAIICLGHLLPEIAKSEAVYKTVSAAARRKIEKTHLARKNASYLKTMAELLEAAPANVTPHNMALIIRQCYVLELERLARAAAERSPDG